MYAFSFCFPSCLGVVESIIFIYLFVDVFMTLAAAQARRMRWARHVARMGRRGMQIGYWWESQEERDHKEDQDVGGWTILK
jgi:hypothetical protein